MQATWFMELPWVLAGSIFIGAFAFLMLFIFWMTRKIVSATTLKKCHDVAGFTYGIIGVVYGVLLGFMVVEVNDHFHQAESNILEETSLLMGLFRDAAVFPKAHTIKIRLHLLEYAKRVYEDEWVTPVKGGESSKARGAMQTLWHTYKSLNPSSTKERIWYQLSLKQLNALNQNRVLRLSHGHQSLGSLMWTLLITGALITVLFLCFFSPESIHVQMSLMSVLAGTIAFMLFFILRMDGIYTADMSLPPKELQQMIENFAETVQNEQKI